MSTRKKRDRLTDGQRLGIWFPPYLAKAVREDADKYHISVSCLIRQAVHYYTHNGHDR